MKYIKVIEKVHVYKCLHLASCKFTAGSKARFFPGPFHFSTRWFCILAEAFRNDHVAAFSTALRSAAENYEVGDYVTARRSFKVPQRSSLADWTIL